MTRKKVEWRLLLLKLFLTHRNSVNNIHIDGREVKVKSNLQCSTIRCHEVEFFLCALFDFIAMDSIVKIRIVWKIVKHCVDWLMDDWFYVCLCTSLCAFDFFIDNENFAMYLAPIIPYNLFDCRRFSRFLNFNFINFQSISESIVQLPRKNAGEWERKQLQNNSIAQQFKAIISLLLMLIKKTAAAEMLYNDASVNVFIRLYLRVMIITRQERHNKNEKKRIKAKKLFHPSSRFFSFCVCVL